MKSVINIVLKKNNKAGFNGNTSFTVGYPSRNNFTGLLNRRSDKLNLFASYSIMDRIGGFDSESEKHTYFSEDKSSYLEPRILATIKLTPAFTFEGAIGENNQFIHQFNSQLSTRGTQEMWLISQGDIPVVNSLSSQISSHWKKDKHEKAEKISLSRNHLSRCRWTSERSTTYLFLTIDIS